MLNCSLSLAIETKWTIHNCSNICSQPIASNQLPIATTYSELFVPSHTLSVGLYELRLTVSMTAAPQFNTTVSAFVKINPSAIIANLITLGTSMINIGYAKDLVLDPGLNSVDPDASSFNSSVSTLIILLWLSYILLIAGLELRLLLSSIWHIPIS